MTDLVFEDMKLEDWDAAVRKICSLTKGHVILQMRAGKMRVHPSFLKVLFPHNILKHRKGARGRAMALKWRRK